MMNMNIKRNEPFLCCSFESRSAEKPPKEETQKVLSNKFITISYVTIHCLRPTILLWFTRSHEFLSNFSLQEQSQEFLFLVYFSQSVFNKKPGCATLMSVLCVCCNVCFEIEIWIGLKAVGHYRGALHFLMALHFSVSICDEYFQFGASLDKIHKINRCRAFSVMRSDAELLSGPAELCRVTLSCTSGMQYCTECLTIWIREGKGSPSDLWSQVPVWQPY